jgi:hypothetical protein
MSKYDQLWEYITHQKKAEIILSFADIERILGFRIDHSFLNYKKELNDYGYKVDKISLKDKWVKFHKISNS